MELASYDEGLLPGVHELVRLALFSAVVLWLCCLLVVWVLKFDGGLFCDGIAQGVGVAK